MENITYDGLLVLETIKFLEAKATTKQHLGPIVVCAERARKAIVSSDQFPAPLVLQLLLVATSSKKSKVCARSLECLVHIIRSRVSTLSVPLGECDQPHCLKDVDSTMQLKEVVVEIVVFCLSTFVEVYVQEPALAAIESLVRNGYTVQHHRYLRCLQAAFNCRITCSQEVSAHADAVLRHLVKHAASQWSAIFTSPGRLTCHGAVNFKTECEPGDFCPIRCVFHPAETMSDREASMIPAIVSTISKLAVRKIASSVTTALNDSSLHSRKLAIELLIDFMRALPSPVPFSDVSTVVFSQVCSVIYANLATSSPEHLFRGAAQLFAATVPTLHSAAPSRDLEILFSVVVGVLKSAHSHFSQKLDIIDSLNELLSAPTIIMLFINYDCIPAKPNIVAGVLDSVAQSAFAEFEEEGWCSSEQQALVQSALRNLISQLSESLERWILEDVRDEESVGFDWRHIHQLRKNKAILDEAATRFNTNWRVGRTYLESRKVVAEGDDLEFGMFLRVYPKVSKTQICKIVEKIVRDDTSRRVFEGYVRAFDYCNVPIDIAFRNTTCAFTSWGSTKPSFEAQVWAAVQETFGKVYAEQNPDRISERDADALSGVILFLHTNLHNAAVAEKMSLESFVKFGSDCLTQKLPPGEMEEIYCRTLAHKWDASPMCPDPPALPVDTTLMTSAQLHQLRHSVSVNQIVSTSIQASEQLPQEYTLQHADPSMEVLFQPVDEIPQASFAPYFAMHARMFLEAHLPLLCSACYATLHNSRSDADVQSVHKSFDTLMHCTSLFGMMEGVADLTQEADKEVQKHLRHANSKKIMQWNISTSVLLLHRI